MVVLIAMLPAYALSKSYSHEGFFVKLESGKKADILKINGIKSIESFTYATGLYYVELASSTTLEETKNQLTKLQGIQYTSYNYFRTVDTKAISTKSTEAPYPIEKPQTQAKWIDDPNGPVQAALMSSVPDIWEKYTIGDSKIIIADIDTGVDYNHKDLAANMWRNSGEEGLDQQGNDKRKNKTDDDKNGYIDDFIGWNYVDKNNLPWDDHGHGTHTSGVAAAVGGNGFGISGVCPRCSIMPLRFIGANGSGEDIDAVRSVEYAIKMKAQIINCSWGGKEESLPLLEIFQAADRAGIILAVAAGNAGTDINLSGYYPAGFDLPNQLTTAALYTTDVYLPWWSNYGNIKVHTSIAGDMIESTIPGDEFSPMSGTSMAAPGIAGTAGLILSYRPNLSGIEIKALMKKYNIPDKGSVSKVAFKGRPDTKKIIKELSELR